MHALEDISTLQTARVPSPREAEDNLLIISAFPLGDNPAPMTGGGNR
jgi:hypothetical protein